MEPIVSSETSAIRTQTPGNYPKRNKLQGIPSLMHFTLREEHRPSVFNNKVMRRISEPKKDEVTGEWRRLYKEKLYAPYS